MCIALVFTAGLGLPSTSQPPIYFGFDPLESVPESVSLLGCVFYVTDYDKYSQGDMADMLSTWKMVSTWQMASTTTVLW